MTLHDDNYDWMTLGLNGETSHAFSQWVSEAGFFTKGTRNSACGLYRIPAKLKPEDDTDTKRCRSCLRVLGKIDNRPTSTIILQHLITSIEDQVKSLKEDNINEELLDRWGYNHSHIKALEWVTERIADLTKSPPTGKP